MNPIGKWHKVASLFQRSIEVDNYKWIDIEKHDNNSGKSINYIVVARKITLSSRMRFAVEVLKVEPVKQPASVNNVYYTQPMIISVCLFNFSILMGSPLDLDFFVNCTQRCYFLNQFMVYIDAKHVWSVKLKKKIEWTLVLMFGFTSN